MTGLSQIPLPQLDWENPNRQKAFNEWRDFMASYMVINKIPANEQWNYILLISGPKGRDLLIASGITEDNKTNPDNVWSV